MTFKELVLRRESCRAYQDRKVEREKIDRCLEAALLAPSACNSQPWRYIVVDEAEAVGRISECAGSASFNRFVRECPAFVVVAEGKANLLAKLGGKVKDQEFASIDIGLSVGNFCLAAAELGLGTCILGMFDEKKTRETLNIPAGTRVRLIIAVGYPQSAQPRPKKRREFCESVCYNEWRFS